MSHCSFVQSLAVEMAAGVAGDLVAFLMGAPDGLSSRVDTSCLFIGKADIRAPGRLARCLIFAARFARQQKDAGQEIGEARAGAGAKVAAALPLRECHAAPSKETGTTCGRFTPSILGAGPASAGNEISAAETSGAGTIDF